jgi:hypothetical protein
MTSWARINSCFERKIGEAAPSCFFKFVFACTVQFTCTIRVNFFFFLVCIVFVYILKKKTSFAFSCKQYFFPEKLV